MKNCHVVESGVVEGFYGRPWSHSARLWCIDFMKNNGFGTYIYAPKDDPFHRERWQEQYPDTEMRRLKTVISTCLKKDIRFCWALSPGLSIKYSDKKDFQALLDKFLWVADLGVDTLALFLDDIPTTLVHKKDKTKWNSLAAAQADLVNRLAAKLREHDKKIRLWFCPTEYIGTKPTPYLETAGKEIGQEIGIFWTGPLVVSPRITVEDAKNIGTILRRKPLLWDNYPVNDYNPNKLNLGPLRARDPGLTDFISGYFTNPMNQAFSSAIPMLTISDYLNNPLEYDSDGSWKAASAAPWGVKLSTPSRSVLRDFCELWPAGFFYGEPAPRLYSQLAEAKAGRPAGFRKSLIEIIDFAGRLKQASKELKGFSQEVGPFCHSLKLDAEAALTALDLQKKPDDAILKKLEKQLERIKNLPVRGTAGNPIRIFATDILTKYRLGKRNI